MLFSASEQTHRVLIACDSDWVTVALHSVFLNIHWSGVLTALFGCYMASVTRMSALSICRTERERDNELAHDELYQHRMIYWWRGIIYLITVEACTFDISVVYLHFCIVLSSSYVSWYLCNCFLSGIILPKLQEILNLYRLLLYFKLWLIQSTFLNRLLLILYIITKKCCFCFFVVLPFVLKCMTVWIDFGQENWDMKRLTVEWPSHAAYCSSVNLLHIGFSP